MKKSILILLAVISLVVIGSVLFMSGVGKLPPQYNTTLVIESCTRACQSALLAEENLSAGPCLLETVYIGECVPGLIACRPIATDWVCDVAHSPRAAVDNLPQNQCQAYRNGTARHFVEVTSNCTFIQAR